MVNMTWLATCVHFSGVCSPVEVEIVLPPDMAVRESHDIALDLQTAIEDMEGVERAFVHVDYQLRDAPEHKHEKQTHDQQVAAALAVGAVRPSQLKLDSLP